MRTPPQHSHVKMQSLHLPFSLLKITVTSSSHLVSFLEILPPPPILNGSSPLASYKACFSFLQSSIGTCAYTGKDSPFLLPIIQALALLCLSVEASLNSHTHCVNFCIFPTLCWLFMLTTFSTV